jgi:hypothetical protein
MARVSAAIAHPHHRLRAFARGLERNGAAARRVVRCVVEQVREHLREAHRIGLDP